MAKLLKSTRTCSRKRGTKAADWEKEGGGEAERNEWVVYSGCFSKKRQMPWTRLHRYLFLAILLRTAPGVPETESVTDTSLLRCVRVCSPSALPFTNSLSHNKKKPQTQKRMHRSSIRRDHGITCWAHCRQRSFLDGEKKPGQREAWRLLHFAVQVMVVVGGDGIAAVADANYQRSPSISFSPRHDAHKHQRKKLQQTKSMPLVCLT